MLIWKALERKMQIQNGHDPDKDFYPAEEAKARFDTMLRACVGIPAASEGRARFARRHCRYHGQARAAQQRPFGRAASLSKDRRRAIAKIAAAKRWRIGGPVEL